MQVIKEFIDAFFNGLEAVVINLFGYSFTFWDVCAAAAVSTIIGRFVWKLFNG